MSVRHAQQPFCEGPVQDDARCATQHPKPERRRHARMPAYARQEMRAAPAASVIMPPPSAPIGAVVAAAAQTAKSKVTTTQPTTKNQRNNANVVSDIVRPLMRRDYSDHPGSWLCASRNRRSLW